MKQLIKKILDENLKRIIVTDENRFDYDITESFDKPSNNVKKMDDFSYEVIEDGVKSHFNFRIEFNNNYFNDFRWISNDVDVFYDFSWGYESNVSRGDKIKYWKTMTTTSFKILDDFIRTMNPKVIKFGDRYTGNFKVYFHEQFLKILKSIFGQNYDVIDYSDKNVIFLVKKEFVILEGTSVRKRMEYLGETLTEAENYWKYPHRRKRQMKGIIKNDYRKEQIKRIINKLRYT